MKWALASSFLIHAGLLGFLPDFSAVPRTLPRTGMIPVELVAVKEEVVPIKKKPQPQKAPPKPKPKPQPKPAAAPKRAKGLYNALISNHVKDLSRKEIPAFTLPEVSLPEKIDDSLPETSLPGGGELFSQSEIFDDMAVAGSPEGTEKLGIEDSLPEGIRQSPVDSDEGIEWRGAPRKVVVKPPVPHVSLKTEGEVQLKFWVDRDGVVSQMIPMKKLDAKVESVALDYLRKWKFEPLPVGKDYLQWGIITLKFRVE
jgi:protein TonB